MTRCKALEHVGSLNVVASDYRPQCDRSGNFYPLQVCLIVCSFVCLFVCLFVCSFVCLYTFVCFLFLCSHVLHIVNFDLFYKE